MKNYFLILAFLMVGCNSSKPENKSIPVSVSKPTATSIPKKVYIEQDITDGKGHVLSSGDGRSIFQRRKKSKSRKVVHQVKKGLFIGGEK